MAQKVSFGEFGIAFVREVLTSAIIGPKIDSQLPKEPVSGETTAINLGPVHLIKVTYRAKVLGIRMRDTALGNYRVDVGLDVSVDVENKNFRMRVEPAFGLTAETYEPLVLFFKVRPVRPEEIVVTPTTPVQGIVDEKIFNEIVKQLREQIATQINTALAKSDRVFNILSMVDQMGAKFEAADAVSQTDALTPASAPASAPAATAPTALPPMETAAIDYAPALPDVGAVASAAANVEVFAQQAQPIVYQKFGENFMNRVITAARVQPKINQALLTSQNGGNYLQGKGDHPLGTFSYVGGILPTKVECQGPMSWGSLRFFFWISLAIDLAVHLPAGTEGWKFNIHVPVYLDAQPHQQPCGVFFDYYPIKVTDLQVTNTQTSLTGVSWWGGLEEKLRSKVVEEINKGLANSADSRFVNLVKMVKESMA